VLGVLEVLLNLVQPHLAVRVQEEGETQQQQQQKGSTESPSVSIMWCVHCREMPEREIA